ncbi:pentatricopeptide repeat-containing protein At4g04790, mitochondrial-like [Tasmannia lanceolata]|uniref:pentatricopeptide repeat-containing protein At4g04790, mitochondrial-like n=1 Tax=Tasmannia lanceolata TaxID=3420 RepID=UPI0040628BFB
MPRQNLKNLSSIVATALKNSPKKCDSNPLPELETLKQLIPSLNPSSPIKSTSEIPNKSSKKSHRAPKKSDSNPLPEFETLEQLIPSLNPSSIKPASEILNKILKKSHRVSSSASSRSKKSALKAVKESTGSSYSEDSPGQILREISSILCGDSVLESVNLPESQIPNNGVNLPESQIPTNGKSADVLDIPWFSNMSHTCISQRRKELSRERKQKWIFKNTQTHRFERLVRMCAQKLGPEATLEVFGKLGRETGVTEYNALIKLCIEEARRRSDEEDCIEQIHNAFQLFRSMREQGFQLEEETYSPFLMYLIDMEMVQEFHFFSKFVKDENPGSFPRLGYYEMLLWIRVNDEEKVQDLCNSVGVDSGPDSFNLAESYLLALCENDREKELLQLLGVVDITRISSVEHLSTIFESLGRLLLENLAEEFILALRTSEAWAEDISSFIFNYAIRLPNLVVEDVISKFKDLHGKLEVLPSSASCEKLITYCCDSLKVHAALDIVEYTCQSGLALSVETFHPILRASEQSLELGLVRPIYSVMRRHDLKPKSETFKNMIYLYVKMKDFDGAHNLLKDMEDMNMMPTANMYNIIMAGYFREKNIHSGLMVLKQMELANVHPDSETFSYLISNCDCEEDIVKFREEFWRAGVQVTKHVFMAFINAYANIGQFDKAKEVVLDKRIPVKAINEIKNVLVSALASNGQMSDALEVYEEIKQAGCSLESKSIISLIEHLRSEGQLSKLLELLGELNDSSSWFDGCGRIVLYCVRYKHLSSAVDLLKQLKEKDELATYIVCDQIFCQIWEIEPTDLEIGLDLLQAVKEEVGLCPSRTSLDFLLSACVGAKDPDSARLIWDEYPKAGLPFNILTSLRMYQVLMASGKQKSAKKLSKEIEKDDPHVRYIIKACEGSYSKPISLQKKSKETDLKKLIHLFKET